MKFYYDIRYKFKHYIQSKPRLFLAIIAKLLGIYLFVYMISLAFPTHPLFGSTWFNSLFLLFVSIATAIVTFNDHSYKGYSHIKRKIIKEYQDELLANTEDKYTMNEVYSMLPDYHKQVFIEAMFEYHSSK